MYYYKVKRIYSSEEFDFESNVKTLDIIDARFLYRCIQSPLKEGTIEDVIKKYPLKKEYLHKKLDKRNLHDITFFEKHKYDVVYKIGNKNLAIKDFWQPCINDVHVTFLKQLTLQISRILFQKIPTCINANTSMSFHANYCIKNNGYCYSFVSVTPLEIPEDFLEIFSIIIIKWKSKSQQFDYVEMHQEVDENSIEFMLCNYDEEERFCESYFKIPTGIPGGLERLIDCVNNRKEDSSCSYEYIDIYDLHKLENLNNYPDIVFKFIFDKEINKNILEQTESIIYKFINKYNSKNKNKIHDAFCINKNNSKKTDNSLLFAVDFGNSNPNSIFELVSFLENSNLSISKIQIR